MLKKTFEETEIVYNDIKTILWRVFDMRNADPEGDQTLDEAITHWGNIFTNRTGWTQEEFETEMNKRGRP